MRLYPMAVLGSHALHNRRMLFASTPPTNHLACHHVPAARPPLFPGAADFHHASPASTPAWFLVPQAAVRVGPASQGHRPRERRRKAPAQRNPAPDDVPARRPPSTSEQGCSLGFGWWEVVHGLPCKYFSPASCCNQRALPVQPATQCTCLYC